MNMDRVKFLTGLSTKHDTLTLARPSIGNSTHNIQKNKQMKANNIKVFSTIPLWYWVDNRVGICIFSEFQPYAGKLKWRWGW